MSEKLYKGNVVLSKSKYQEFDKHLKELVSPDIYLKISDVFKETFKFDANVCSSNPYAVEKTKQYRNKLKEEGISTYISSGAKKSYEKKKQLIELKVL
jgi:hypothetical protein